MPRRSSRIKNQNEEQKDFEPGIDDNNTSELKARECNPPRKTKVSYAQASPERDTNKESVSNDESEEDYKNTNMQIEQKEQSESVSAESSVDPAVTTSVKRLSIDPNTILPPILASNDIEMADIEEDKENESDDYEPGRRPKTLAQTRTRRSRPTISYKDDSSSDEDMCSDSDDDNVLFIGLTKQERQELREKMDGIQSQYSDAIRKERELKLQEIISSFEFNITQKITHEEAAFIYDFCRKFQWDVNDKIEEEGDFFLIHMREMMDEKRKQVCAGVRCSKKRAKNDDSESEFDLNDYDDSDSEYSFSDWSNPDLDNENMISDDEEFGRKKRKRNKNVWRDKDGREYRAAGRLLLNDALKDTENFEGWSGARVQAWKNKKVNPNAYYYRFNDPGEAQINGRIGMDEHKTFMERVLECGVNVHWGTFSIKVPGRVGYQCSNYWRQMMKDGWVKDPNYWIRKDGSFQFKRAKKGSIPDKLRRYSFVVVKDPSKVFEEGGFHPKRPSDKHLSKYLDENVKELSEREKKGKGKKGKKKVDSNSNSKKEEDDNEKVKEDNGKVEVEENEKKSKKKSKKKKKDKKKKSKKKKKDASDSSEGKKSKKKKKKDKSKKKKDKKKKKSKKKKNKKGDIEMEEGNEETNSKTECVRDKKRKRDENGEVSEHEPPQKKRKIISKEKEEDNNNNNVLCNMIDVMTGDKLLVPAISPYGHVMEYNSWCSILRNARTKNKCPFTQQKLTRRSLVKLDENNIEEYKDKIVNITAEDIKQFKQSS